MSGSHTPGPWDIALDTVRDGDITVFAEDRAVAMMKTYEDVPRDTTLAEARLIAAAPELLAACKMALEQGDLFNADADIVRSAIAKAEGR
jgi:hypothetical protein